MLVPIGDARECLTTSSVGWGGGGEGLVVAFTDPGGVTTATTATVDF